MKKNLFRIVAAAGALLMLLSALPASAASYNSYTYSIDGDSLASPDAYTPDRVVGAKEMGLEKALNSPTAIETDSDGNVYIADPMNNRIVVLNDHYQLRFEITSFVNSEGVPDSLNAAQGVFVWEGKVQSEENPENYELSRQIYVADTKNKRLVIFNEDGSFLRIVEQPSSEVFASTEIYSPIAVAADSSGRIYVVSNTTYQGIISLSSDGTFAGYIGAQKVSYSVLKKIWRKFQTAEQRKAEVQDLSTEYNAIDIDEEGFIYVTSNAIEEANLISAINSGDKGYAPVKKLNTVGNDIMRRNGFQIPAGEINFRNNYGGGNGTSDRITGPSSIIGVALGPNGTWSIADEKRSKIYTYNNNGELLHVFGDQGTQKGNLQKISALSYQGKNLLVLDSNTASFTVYKTTDYGELLLTAIDHTNNLLYSEAKNDWQEILKHNNNFDAAYVGLGKAYYREGNWEQAMYYFERAYDTSDYSDAFGQWRKEWIETGIHIVYIPVVVVAFILLLYFFFRYAGKVNKKAAVSGKKKTFKEEVLYCTHVIFHPFDGFWDLKHEKRGSMRGALLILALAVVSFAYQAIGQAFIFNPTGGYSSIIGQLLGLLVPLLLGATANWCLTTLFDGEGSFKDIFIALCYSLTPIILFVPVSTLLTHVVTSSEAGFISLLLSLCYVWVGMLIFFGTMVTHDYSLGKNVLTLLGTILCACVIMFVAVLFSSLIMKMASFVSNLVTEATYRM